MSSVSGKGVTRITIQFSLDRDIDDPQWRADGRGLFFQYASEGNGKLGYVSLAGKHEVVAENVGGLDLGRPYASGAFDVARDGSLVYTLSRPDHPADLAFKRGSGPVQRYTRLNDDLFAGNPAVDAKVAASWAMCDVALLTLEKAPMDVNPVVIGDSDKVEVGDSASARRTTSARSRAGSSSRRASTRAAATR